MKLINNLFRLINRKRHSAGFGVHSPFAFNLILDTIYTPHSYYIYNDNKNKLQRAGIEDKANLKYAKLLFRLVNRFDAKNILEIGSEKGINTLYLKGHSKQTKVTCATESEEMMKAAKSLLSDNFGNITFTNTLPIVKCGYDAIIWDLKAQKYNQEETIKVLTDSIKQDGFVVVNHINKGKQNKSMWQDICSIDSLTMSFDLGSIGIGFFKPSLPKLNYDLYF